MRSIITPTVSAIIMTLFLYCLLLSLWRLVTKSLPPTYPGEKGEWGNTRSGARQSGRCAFKAPVQAVAHWLWANHWPFQSVSFFICKMELIKIVATQGCCEVIRRQYETERTVLQTRYLSHGASSTLPSEQKPPPTAPMSNWLLIDASDFYWMPSSWQSTWLSEC